MATSPDVYLLPPGSSLPGPYSVDVVGLVNPNSVLAGRQICALGDPSTGNWANLAAVMSSTPFGTEFGLVVRTSGVGSSFLVDSAGTNKAAVDASGLLSIKVGQGANVATVDANGSLQVNQFPARPATVQASAAQTVTGNSGAGINVAAYRSLLVFVGVTAASGTNPNLTVWLQSSPDAGTTWFDIQQVLPPTNVSGVGTTPVLVAQSFGMGTTAGDFGNLVRARWVISGTASPSITFAVTAIAK